MIRKSKTIQHLALAISLFGCAEQLTTIQTNDTGSLSLQVVASERYQDYDVSVIASIGEQTYATNLTEGTKFFATIIPNIPVGEYSVGVSVYPLGSSEPIEEVSASTSVSTDTVSGLSVAIGTDYQYQLSSLSVDNAAPLTTETVQLSLTTAGDLGYRATMWSDNCRGEFVSTGTDTAQWRNPWAENCTINVFGDNASDTTPLTIDITTKYASGTYEVLSGTSCNYTEDGPQNASGPLQGENGPANLAQHGPPAGVAIAGNGDVIFTDRNGGRLLKVRASDGKLIRILGKIEGKQASLGDDGSTPATLSTLNMPQDVEISPAGNYYVSEYWSDQIRQIYASTGTSTSFSYSNPMGLEIDGQNNLYVGDQDDGDITRFNASGNTSLLSEGAFDIESYNQQIYYTRRWDYQIYKADKDGNNVELVAGNGEDHGFSGDGGPATQATFGELYGLGIAKKVSGVPDGTIYVADRNNQAIRKITPAGIVSTVVGPRVLEALTGQTSGGGGGSAPAYIPLLSGGGGGGPSPSSLPDAGIVSTGAPILTLPGDQGYVLNPLGGPRDVELDKQGNLYIADQFKCQIIKVHGPL